MSRAILNSPAGNPGGHETALNRPAAPGIKASGHQSAAGQPGRRARLKPCPANGVHNWVYYAACSCEEAGLTDAEALPLIESRMTREPSPSNEVESALAAAYGQRGAVAGPKWPERNRARIAEIARTGPGLDGLRALSPVQWADDERRSDEIIDALFPGNPLLCVGRAQDRVATKPREAWRGKLSGCQFIVPNPMSARTGVTKAGKSGSARTEDNTGPRRFLVVECDFKETDQLGVDTPDARMLRGLAADGIAIADLCAAVIDHQTHYLPLALVVHSGGKSLHGWFSVVGRTERELEDFMRYAVSLGADDKMWQKCQLARLPDGTRDNGKRQEVLYFNPEVLR